MKRKWRSAFWTALVIFALFCPGWAWAAPSDALLEEEQLEFDQMYAKLEGLTPEELLADLERACQLLDQSGWEDKDNALIPWGAAMAERIDELTEEQLADVILNPEKDLYFRGAVVQLRELRQDAAQADPRLYQLLEDEEAPEYLRTTLMLHLDFDGPERQELLERLAAGQDVLAVYAQKKLDWDSRETAYQSRSNPVVGSFGGWRWSADGGLGVSPLGRPTFPRIRGRNAVTFCQRPGSEERRMLKNSRIGQTDSGCFFAAEKPRVGHSALT